MIIRPYQTRERVDAVQPYDPTAVNVAVAAGQQILEEQRKRDLEQRDSDATIGMLNVETNINKRLVDTQKQLDENGQINGVNYPDIASEIRVDEYKDFTPPPELKNKYNEQQAVYQARQALTSHDHYSSIKEKKIKADFKKTYSDIAILTTRETADENIEKITLLVDGMTLSGTQRNLLLTSSIQGHNNQMYRNDINNPDNNVERLEFQHKEFKNNKYSVGVENHKTIDKLFISKIKTKKMANVAFDKTQKKYQREQTITLLEGCSTIDSAGEGCDFKPYINDLEYTREQRENFKDFENVQKPLRNLFINMAGGYSAEIDKVRSKLARDVAADENVYSKKKLAYIDKMRSQFETRIRQPGGIDFIIAQINKGDNTDIMGGAERLSAEWMGKANSLMARVGLSEQERILLTRELREQLVTKPFDTVESILAIAEQEGWDDTTRRVAIKEINKVTGLPKGTSILLTQDSTKGTRALKDYKNNKELYKKSDPDAKLNTYWSTDLTREKLRRSGLPAEDLIRFDSAVEIQALSTWQLTGDDMVSVYGGGIFASTYQEIIDKNFTFSSDEINGGQLRFDSSKVSQDLADVYKLALSYIIDKPEILDRLVNWDAMGENYDKEEVYDLISDARVISINNDTEFKLLNGFIIPFNESITWEQTKEIYDKHIAESQSNLSLRFNL